MRSSPSRPFAGDGTERENRIAASLLRLNAGVFFGDARCVLLDTGIPFPPAYTLSLVGVFLAADLRIFDNGSREGLGPIPLLDAFENPRGNKCFDLSVIERRFNPLLARATRNVR